MICSSSILFEPCKLVLTKITVADGLHPLFNTYSAYAYLPSDASMDALLAVIKSRNEAWQQVINEVPSISGQIRDLIVCCYFLFKILALNVKPGFDQPRGLE